MGYYGAKTAHIAKSNTKPKCSPCQEHGELRVQADAASRRGLILMLGLGEPPMFRIFPVCLVVFGIVFMYLGHQHAIKFAALRDHGKTTKAEITKLEWKERKKWHDDNLYTAHVRFTTEDGREIRAEVGIATEFGRALRNNSAPSTMTVRYLPEAPSTLQDINHDDSSDAQKGVGRYMLLAGLAMLAIRFFFSRRAA
jgi:hypothetical protein